jgi:hypothetical protein
MHQGNWVNRMKPDCARCNGLEKGNGGTISDERLRVLEAGQALD